MKDSEEKHLENLLEEENLKENSYLSMNGEKTIPSVL